MAYHIKNRRPKNYYKLSKKKYIKKSFAQLGNLAFYKGWSPNYFYFKSLVHYSHLGENENVGIIERIQS
jgi:hypothetical protein